MAEPNLIYSNLRCYRAYRRSYTPTKGVSYFQAVLIQTRMLPATIGRFIALLSKGEASMKTRSTVMILVGLCLLAGFGHGLAQDAPWADWQVERDEHNGDTTYSPTSPTRKPRSSRQS